MKKPLFDNEGEFKHFIREIGYYISAEGLKQARSLGYIEKSIVDEAEDLYKHYCDHGNSEAEIEATIETLHDAVQFLRQQLKEAGK